MDLCWCPVRPAVMQPGSIVEREGACEARFKRRDARLVVEGTGLILDRPPEPCDKAMVQRAAPAIQADRHPRPG